MSPNESLYLHLLTLGLGLMVDKIMISQNGLVLIYRMYIKVYRKREVKLLIKLELLVR